MVAQSTINKIRQYSIKEYLSSIGFEGRRQGNKYYYSSPFTQDRNPSFVLYPENTFYCFATSKGGDIINLVMEVSKTNFIGAVSQLSKQSFSKANIDYYDGFINKKKYFNLAKYINNRKNEVALIEQYAGRRKIKSGYFPGVYFDWDSHNKSWNRNPALLFPHRDYSMEICGCQMRTIEDKYPKFSTRGVSRFYVLDNITDSNPSLFVCESETSSNSLYQYIIENTISAIVISIGSVTNIPEKIPDLYGWIEKKYLIIDYDGGDEYNERVEKFKHLDLEEIVIDLPKGEDLNSLYVKGKLEI